MQLLAIVALVAGGLLATAIAGIRFARRTFLRSIGWLLGHLAVFGLAHFAFGVPGFLLMFFLPLVFCVVLGVEAGHACAQSPSPIARLAPLGASLPAAVAFNIAGIWIHIEELGAPPRGDNALLYVFAQVVWGIPAQGVLLIASTALTWWWLARRRERRPVPV